jgi:Zn-dependent protease
MMKAGWRIGSLFGIPIRIAPSWFIVLAVVTYAYGNNWLMMDWDTTVVWTAAVTMSMALFGSVLLHELGHSLVARSQQIPVQSITLFMFGGVANISQESRTPGQAFQVAIAGPAVSFALFILLALLDLVLPQASPGGTVVANLAGLNLLLALFNMIPGLPLDGGQVLKATLWKLTGSRLAGVRWAARAGWLLSGLAIALSLYGVIRYGMVSLLWMTLIGWFGIRHAHAHQKFADLQRILLRLTVSHAMTRTFVMMDGNRTVREFQQQYPHGDRPSVIFTTADPQQGVIGLDTLLALPSDTWDQPLAAIAQPIDRRLMLAEDVPLATAIDQLEHSPMPWLVVTSPTGAIAGVLDRGDIVRTIANALKQPIAETIVQRIKTDHAYPDRLPLVAIAQTARIGI